MFVKVSVFLFLRLFITFEQFVCIRGDSNILAFARVGLPSYSGKQTGALTPGLLTLDRLGTLVDVKNYEYEKFGVCESFARSERIVEM